MKELNTPIMEFLENYKADWKILFFECLYDPYNKPVGIKFESLMVAMMNYAHVISYTFILFQVLHKTKIYYVAPLKWLW